MQISKLKFSLLFLILILGGIAFILSNSTDQPQATKLYWFIPDGTRADPDLFTIYKWAKEGKLPNIKKMMEEGSFGYSIPVYSTNSPPNFASLFTGAYPEIHGVAGSAMYMEGASMENPSAGGFSSTSRKVPAIWSVFENEGKKVILLSIPGSTPPELKHGITIRGRSAAGGVNTEALIFESKEKRPERKLYRHRFVFRRDIDSSIPLFIESYPALNWLEEKSFSIPMEARLKAYGITIYAYIYDSTDNNKIDYDRIFFSFGNAQKITVLKEGEWSKWIPIEAQFNGVTFSSHLKIKVIKLWKDGTFRIRAFYNNINKFNTFPSHIAEEIVNGTGPMVDLTDLWSGALNYEPQDKTTFLEEAEMTFEWHQKAIPFIFQKYKPDVFIQEAYIPNMMLESRWWLGRIDKEKQGYSESLAFDALKEVLWMYKKIDALIGEAMKKADENTLIVFSSDHGIATLHHTFNLNNFLAKNGWLKFHIDEKSGNPMVDWAESKAVFVRAGNIYINPNGLGGPRYRASGSEYERLRDEIIHSLKDFSDKSGKNPFVKILKWEEAAKELHLPPDRIGDIVIVSERDYDIAEDMDEDLTLFQDSVKTGHKNAVDPNEISVRTPFIIMGKGVKKGFELSKPIRHIDQMPTILNLLGIKIPEYVQGRVIEELKR